MEKKISIVVFVVFMSIAFYVWVIRDNDKKEILKYHEFTTGQITDYYIIGIHNTRYLTYKYAVNNKEYIRKINIQKNFDYCENEIEKCTNKLFWVIYCPDKPEKSLIDLSNDIYGIDNPKIPFNTNNF